MNMKSKPLVSVIVPVYNSAPTITICLESLIRQDCPADDLEIIAIDDGSTDGSGTLIRSEANFSDVVWITHPVNRGLAAARNSGICQARGEILIFLDADMTVQPDFIRRHVERLNDPTVNGVMGRLRYAAGLPYDKYQRYLYEGRRGARRRPAGQPLPFQFFLLGLTSLKKKVIETVGLFDERLTGYGGEDTEFAWRIWRNWPEGLFYDPAIVVTHHHYRPFEAVLQLVEQFGRQGVPALVNRHPDFRDLYHVDWVAPDSHRHRWLVQTGGWIVRQPFMQYLARAGMQLSPYPLSNGWVRLALASALLRGIHAARE